MENNQQSFYQFSDQLRGQASNLANLSLNDPLWSNNSIWSNTHVSKRTDERRNSDIKLSGEVNLAANLKPKSSDVNGFDIRVGGEVNSKPRSSDFNGFNNNWDVRVGGDVNSAANLKPRSSDFNGFNNNWDVRVGGDVNSAANLKPRATNFNGFNDNWKMGMGNGVGYGPIGSVPGGSLNNNAAVNGGFNKGIYSSTGNNFNSFNIGNSNFKGIKNRGNDFPEQQGGKNSKKNNNKKNNNNNNDNEKTATEKRFKTLPPAEALPRNETIGGYIFVCNNDTMSENLQRQLFGLPPRYRDSVRAITPGLPLFLYNYSTHQLHGIFEAASFGGTNIDSTAWEDKKSHGESRFPAQVRVITRKICVPLEEDSFRPILHHYDGPKFRLELSVPEAISLLDVFAEQNSLDIFGEQNQ